MGMELEQDDPIDLDQHDDDLPEEGEQPLAELEDDQEGEPQADAEDDSEIVVTIGEETPPEEEDLRKAPPWVGDVRKKNRELSRKVRELESQLQKTTSPQQAPVIGKKPTLEDHDYDAEAFEVALESWHEQKRAALEFEQKQKAAQAEQEKEWAEDVNKYTQAKQRLKVRDFDEVESVVQDTLNPMQQAIILKGAENPEIVVYALGKNAKKAKELAAITDPVKYAFAIAKLETQLKVQPRKAPPPERTVTGSGGVSGGAIGDQLARLQAEAEKTGDYTKVFEYRKQKRQAK